MHNASTSDPGKYTIREADRDDWPVIVEFNRRLAAETEDRALDLAVLTAGVQAALSDRGKARYYVACCDEVIVGQLMHTWEWSDWRNGTIWWLQSVYVADEHRGSGVFRGLFDHLKSLAADDETVVGIRLYIEHANDRARAVYGRLGMTSGGYDVLEQIWER